MSNPAFRWNGTAVFVATGFHSGYFPFAPGTVGSAVAVPMYFALRLGGDVVFGAGLVIVTAIAIASANVAERHFGKKDPSAIVVDEIAGMLLTMFLVPFSWLSLIAGFLLFRLSDIVKPFPARSCERLPGGWGIVLDDLVAALYANLALRVLLHFHLL